MKITAICNFIPNRFLKLFTSSAENNVNVVTYELITHKHVWVKHTINLVILGTKLILRNFINE